MSVWVFGFGSLVAPASMARTIGRMPDERRVAHLEGYGRRWNYGSLHLRGDWVHEGVAVNGGVVVSLGLVVAPLESTNGVLVRVDDEELARLDDRERDYERTEVTGKVRLGDGSPGASLGEPLLTYVPRASSVSRYRRARDGGRAAVRLSYWEMVHRAFADLGGDHLERLLRTPLPDVPVVDISLRPLPEEPRRSPTGRGDRPAR